MLEKVKTIILVNKTSKIIYILFYFIPFIYIDLLGINFLLSAVGLTLFIYPEALDKKNEKTNKSDLPFLIISISFAYISMLLHVNGEISNSLTIGRFEILPTYLFLIYYLVPMLWVLFIEKNKFKSFVKIDKKIIIYISFLCLPIIKSNINWALTQNNLNYSIYDSWKEVYQAFIIAAIAEELFFRGLIYNLLKKAVNMPIAQVLSSIIFTFWHINLLKPAFIGFSLDSILNLIEIFVLGIVLSCIYERSKSLIAAILFHGFINGGFKFALLSLMIIAK